MKIYPHNQHAIDNVLALLESKNKVCVVHPTGTGKAVIIAQLLEKFVPKQCIVIGPTTLIEKEISKHTPHTFTFYTFKALELMSKEEIDAITFDYLFIDEFHRMGAYVWYRIIRKIESNNPCSKYIGLSATPIRYLNNMRDMADEFFEGNVASYISLITAIKSNILPLPRYVSAIYSVDNEYRKLVKKIIGTNNRKIYIERIKAAIIDWDKASGLLSVFTKHLREHDNKFIVFCSKLSDIHSVKRKLVSIFKSIKGKVNCYTIISSNGYSTNNTLLQKFSDDDGPCLCFTVDMFNEAIHMDGIKGIDGVILMRFTSSPNVYYQQIGRCLSVNQVRQPIVFDLVNNFNSLMQSKFKRDLEKEFYDTNDLPQIPKRLMMGRANTNKELINVSFFDETKEIKTLFAGFAAGFESWNIYYNLLEELVKQGKPITRKDNPGVYRFIHSNKQKFKDGLLEPDKAKRLQELGIDLKVSSYPDKWQMLMEGVEWRNPGAPLYNWMRSQRSKYLKGELIEERVTLLKNAGVNLEVIPLKTFDEFLEEYNAYRAQVTDAPMNEELKKWVRNQKSIYRRGYISAENKRKLDDIGFMKYTGKDRTWELSFAKYLSGKIDKSLREWIRDQKEAFQDGFMKSWREEKLKAAGFDFAPTVIVTWEETYSLIKENPNWKMERALNKWVIEQNRKFREGRLSDEQIARLRAIGIELRSDPIRPPQPSKSFDEFLAEYKQFLQDTAEPAMNPEIKKWVINQRARYNSGRMPEDRKKLLDEVGIMNKPLKERSWRLRYESYVAGIRDALVLAWARKQRSDYMHGKLAADKLEKLRLIGFDFSANEQMSAA